MPPLEWLGTALLVLIGVFLFVIGAAVGSFLNVCIVRIPYETSILWPASPCGHCFQPVRPWDNIPLLSYWLLLGRCRTCGARFSVRYFLIELLVAVSFPLLFFLEIVNNPAAQTLFGGDFLSAGFDPVRAFLWF